METWMWWALGAVVLFMLFKPSAPAASTLSPAELDAWIKEKKNLQLIDVRTPQEYSAGHLAGARLIPLGELPQRLAELDPKRPLALYCHSGKRSTSALRLLLGKGYPEAKHLGGGISAWQGAGLPVTR